MTKFTRYAVAINLLSLCLLGLAACKQSPNTDNTQADLEMSSDMQEMASGVPETENGTASDSLGEYGASNARLAFDFGTQFPLLDSLLRSNARLYQLTSRYAAFVLQPAQIQTSEILENLLFAQRDQIREQMRSLIENQDAQWLDEQWQRLESELNRLGMTMLSAEGQFIGLGNSVMLQEVVDRIASDALKWYLRFLYASDETANGEYPFLQMSPYQEMILAGENLQKLQPNPYFSKIESQYQRALLCMTDVHRVGDPAARTQDKQLMVGGVNTEAYPFATEVNSRQAFAREGTSRYHAVMQKILANTSEMSDNPDHLYVIVTEWVEAEEMARNRVYQLLESGRDIPHYLKIRRPDGTDAYGIIYRFFEDADKAEAAISKIEKEIPSAELRMVSYRKGELYELESNMN